MSATMQQHLDRAVVLADRATLVFFSMFLTALITCIPIPVVILTGVGIAVIQVGIAVALICRSNWHSKMGQS